MISIVTAARDLARLREIYVVLVRHGFGEIVSRLRIPRRHDRDGSNVGDSAPPPPDRDFIPPEELSRGEQERTRISRGERLRLVAQDLGPTFIKLGQVLSTRTDVIPADIVAELRKLQDNVAAVGFADIRQQVERTLGTSLQDIYEWFDPAPLAAASIGQVHRARLKSADGPIEVVVKVQRPGVVELVARDLDLLHGLARLVERAIPESRIYAPRRLVDEFERAISAELDFRSEADNARRFAGNFVDDPSVVFPCVYDEASGKCVLTLQYLEGLKIYDAVQAGFDRQAIARRALGVAIKQIMADGFFHADPHPGNILLMGSKDEPVFAMIDCGMVGRLPPDMRDKTLDLMLATVRRDYGAMADALYAIGTPTRKVDMRAYRADVSALADRYLGKQLKDISLAALVRDIVEGATRHGLAIPADFLLVGKALMTIESVARDVMPTFDVFEEARPHFFDLLRKRYSPQRLGNELWRGLEKLTSVAYEMPVQVGEILDDLRMGRLAMKISVPELPGAVDRLGRRMLTGLVVAAFVMSGAALLAMGRHPYLASALLVLGLAVLVGHVVLDLRRR